eukprot:comp24129_c1_seq1/m.43808 comp24129_c1_seq1/g.43808  ORF comp24129_c1_seq1/g.43808 comp24129_c1_seq1/m.43808 type:complete len:632 (-) comp24129_c1_seq1:563-2458(-)
MKFTEHLEANAPKEWRFNFVDYKALKGFLRRNTEAARWDDNLEAKFIVMLENELKKVSDFSHVKFDELARRVQFLERNINAEKDPANCEKAAQYKQELDEITKEVAKLSHYNTLNYTAFVKILKKHDKYTDHLLHHTFMAVLSTHPFYKMGFDPILSILSRLYSLLKPPTSGTTQAAGRGSKGTSHMFWVHPDNVTDVKLYILQNLPVYSSKQDPSQKHGETMSSVYFDNPQLELYHQRTEKADIAQSVRISWYGPRSNEVRVERKVHTNYWTGDTTSKQRFSIKSKVVPMYLKGNYQVRAKKEKLVREGKGVEEVEGMVSAAEEVQKTILERHLVPCVRVCHSRTTFEHDTDHEVRITLDTDYCFIRETPPPTGEWCRPAVFPPYDNIRPSDLSRFPYAVLNVKVSSEGKHPRWVEDLMKSHLVESVPRFSPYIHGVSVLFEEKVRVFPFWLIQMEKDIRKSPTSSIVDRLNKGLPPPPMPNGVNAGNSMSQSTIIPIRDPQSTFKKPIAIPVRVEPKVFFANERTFLNWLHTAILVSTIGISLLNLVGPSGAQAKASQVAGFTLIPVALVFLIYSAYTYYWRDFKIRTRDPGPYNTVAGPILITSVFVLSLVLNYCVWLGENGLGWLSE